MTALAAADPSRAAIADARELFAVYRRKRAAAIDWRLDHLTDPDAAPLWRAFRTGSLWQQRGPLRSALRAALAAAERDIPFPDAAP